MATGTLGTNANNSLTSLIFKPGVGSGMLAADYAAINAAILADGAPVNQPEFRWDPSGILYLPKKRGFIRMIAGDYIGVDNQGWPIVVSANSIANAAWTHT